MSSSAGIRIQRLALVALVGALITVLAMLVPSRTAVAFGIGLLLLAAGLVLSAPAVLLAGVFATTFAYWRVGPASFDISLGDAVTILALCAAVPFVPWHSRTLRRVLLGFVAYMAVLLVAVLANPTDRAIAEWAHRSLLIGGALLIGAAAGSRGQAALALKAFIYAGAAVAVLSIADTLTSGFNPAYPLGMHKNGAGPLMGMGVVLLIAAPWRLELRPSTVRHLRVLLIAGVFATQSRGAGLALVAVIAIYAMRHPSARRRAPIFFLVVSLVLLVVSALTLQENTENNPQFNGVQLRENAYDIAIDDVWKPHPLLGGGLRWFVDPQSTAGAIHNSVISELSEAGIIGLGGYIAMFATFLLVLFPRRDQLGEAALLILIFYLLFGLTAIFWIAGMITLPMLVVGLAIGEVSASGSDTIVPAEVGRTDGTKRPKRTP
jgi:O-antigen ligase